MPLPLTAAAGRVLAVAQQSTVAVPPLDNSAMDGYAVRLADIPAAGVCLPVSQRIPAGTVGTPLQPGTAARIFTGAPVPAGADAVVMQERCEHGEGGVVINSRAAPARTSAGPAKTSPIGAEILKPPASSCGRRTSRSPPRPVCRNCRSIVACELASSSPATNWCSRASRCRRAPSTTPTATRCARCSKAWAAKCAISARCRTISNRPAMRCAAAAEDNDLIITSGGVSVGEEDHVKPAVEAEGRLDMWKIAIKPGKPLAFGEVRKTDGKAWFIGLPGNPVSAFVTFLIMVRPFILRLQGVADVLPHSYTLRADFDWKKPDPRTEFLRGRLNGTGGVELYKNQGAGVVTSLSWGDGLIVKAPQQVIAAGESVRFIPFAELLA